MSKFKVGDFVVRLDLNSDFVYRIKLVENCDAMIVRYKGKKPWFTAVSLNELRNATPEEIKAGRRLP